MQEQRLLPPCSNATDGRLGRAGLRLPSRIAACAAALALLSACAPEVGSERWCAVMRDTPRGDWTANEALDFARHCVFETDDEE